jgi:hypothetical protein
MVAKSEPVSGMGAKQIYDVLVRNGAYRIKCSWDEFSHWNHAVFKNLEMHGIIDDVKVQKGIWHGYRAGIMVTKDNRVVAVYASKYDGDFRHWEHDEENIYIAGLVPFKMSYVMIKEKLVRIRWRRLDYSFWWKTKSWKRVKLPVLPSEDAEKVLRALYERAWHPEERVWPLIGGKAGKQ